MTQFELSDEEYLELLEQYKSVPLELFRPIEVIDEYKAHFNKNTCVECSEPIDTENHARIGEIDYMICERDSCWTLSYFSSKHLEASSYSVTFTSDIPVTKLQVAKLANQLWNYSQTSQIEMPMNVESEVFSNIEETGEGWFWAHYVPLHWTFAYEEAEDKEDLDEIKMLTFSEKVELLKERHWACLAEYGWADEQDSILSRMKKISIDGCAFEVTVSDFTDSKVQFGPSETNFYLY